MDRATVDYIADAKVGDWVWCLDGNATVYSDDRKYLGRGKWRLEKVTSVSRKYFSVGDDWQKRDFGIGTGWPRTVRGFTPPDRAVGEVEKWLGTNKRKIVEAIEGLDANGLIEVAKLVGIQSPSRPTTGEK